MQKSRTAAERRNNASHGREPVEPIQAEVPAPTGRHTGRELGVVPPGLGLLPILATGSRPWLELYRSLRELTFGTQSFNRRRQPQ